MPFHHHQEEEEGPRWWVSSSGIRSPRVVRRKRVRKLGTQTQPSRNYHRGQQLANYTGIFFPTKPKSCDTCDSLVIEHLKWMDLKLFGTFSKALILRLPSSPGRGVVRVCRLPKSRSARQHEGPGVLGKNRGPQVRPGPTPHRRSELRRKPGERRTRAGALRMPNGPKGVRVASRFPPARAVEPGTGTVIARQRQQPPLAPAF